MPLPLAMHVYGTLVELILVALRPHFGSFWGSFWGPRRLQIAIPLGVLKFLLLKRLWDRIWLIFGCPWALHFGAMLANFGHGVPSALQCKFGCIFDMVWVPFWRNCHKFLFCDELGVNLERKNMWFGYHFGVSLGSSWGHSGISLRAVSAIRNLIRIVPE